MKTIVPAQKIRVALCASRRQLAIKFYQMRSDSFSARAAITLKERQSRTGERADV